MGRFIDEEILMLDIRNTITEKSETIDWLNLINRQKTAFDIDKVLGTLENEKEHYLTLQKEEESVNGCTVKAQIYHDKACSFDFAIGIIQENC